MARFNMTMLSWQWRGLSVGLTLNVLCAVAGLALLALSGWLICSAAIAGMLSTTAMAFNYFLPAAGIRFFALTRIGSRYAERTVNHNATFKILRDLRTHCYQRLEPLAPAHFLRYQSGDLWQRFVGDIESLNHFYLRVLSPATTTLLMVVGLTCFVSYFSAQLSLLWTVTWCVVAAMLFLAALLGRKVGCQLVRVIAEMRNQIVVIMQAYTEMVVFNKRWQCHNDLMAQHDKLAKLQQRQSHQQGACHAAISLLMGCVLLFTLYLGVGLIKQQQLSAAILGMLILLLMAAFEILRPLPAALVFWGQTQLAAERIEQVLNEPVPVRYTENKRAVLNGHALCIRQLFFRHSNQSQWLLSDVNMDINQGECIIVRGESGQGKTTLAHLLVRSWDPGSGRIHLGGVDISRLPQTQLRQHIVMAQQHTHIFNASVRANLQLAGASVSDEQIWAALQAVELASVIHTSQAGLDTPMGEFGYRFSGGQLKRIGLARVLLSRANVVILDEPAASLDPLTFRRVWQGMQSGLTGRSVIVITHQSHWLDSSVRGYRLSEGKVLRV